MRLRNIGIEAGAGCGKTTRITEDILKGLMQGDFNIDDIVVITFTKKAANELKSRISLKLQEAAGSGDKRLENQLKSIGNARISTIHSFCEGLLKERPVEAGADPGCSVIDETEQSNFLNEIYDEWLQRRLEKNPDFYRKLVLDLGIELKTPDYSFSVKDSSFQGIVKIALEYRELDLFFPKKPSSPETNIKKYLQKVKSLKKQTTAQSLIDFMDDYIDRLEIDYKKYQEKYFSGISGKFRPGNRGGKDCRALRQEWIGVCEEHYRKVIYSIRYPEIEKLYKETNKEVLDFVAYYREAMRKQGVIDFNEILYKTERLLAEDRQVREYFKEKFSFIFVDEFQDTDPLQAKILYYLAEKKGESADSWKDVNLEIGKIYVVGDPKQSIYRFRRADIEMYTSVMGKIAGPKKELLSTNYRSSKKIIDWVNGFFTGRIKKPADGNYQADYVSLDYYKKIEGDVVFVEPDINPEKIEKQNKDDAREIEAQLTASWIRKLVDSGQYSFGDILVLYKTKANMQRTAQYLEELDIPYEMVGAKSYFGRGEILDMSNFLKAIANPIDQISIIAALKGPFFSLSDRDLYTWKLNGENFDYRGVDERSSHNVGKALYELMVLHKKSRTSYAGDMLKRLLENKGIMASYMATYRGKQKVLNIIKAVELLDRLGAVPFCDAVYDFAEKLDQNIEMADFTPITGESNAVQLMTIHKAKGLEQKVVYLADSTSNNIIKNHVFIDTTEGKIIYKIKGNYETPEYSEWDELDRLRDEAEAERLRYVAATRAEELLVVNKVLCNGFEGTFIAPFFSGKQKVKTEKLDVSGLSITPGRKPGKLSPKHSDVFEKEIKRIKEDIPCAIKDASRPSVPVQSPSAADEGESDVIVKIVYDPETPDFRIEGVPASTVGILVHKLMEINPSDLKTAAKTLIENEQVKIETAELVSIVKSLRKKDLLKRIEKSKTVLREVPIKFKNSDGIFYDGNIDLLFEEDDGWVLVDYKAITVADEKEKKRVEKKYRGQLQIYAEGLKKVGIKVKESMIVTC